MKEEVSCGPDRTNPSIGSSNLVKCGLTFSSQFKAILNPEDANKYLVPCPITFYQRHRQSFYFTQQELIRDG